MKTNRTRIAAPDEDLVRLELLLKAHHQASSSNSPITQKMICQTLGWSQAKASRMMKRLLQGGMKEYRQHCRSNRLRGFIDRSDDGTATVDAFFRDSIELPD